MDTGASLVCYRCGYTFEGHEPTAGTHGAPVEGDVCICQACGAVALFTGIGMLTRMPTLAEVDEILEDVDVVTRIAAIEKARRQAVHIGRQRRAAAARLN